jgi:hypothetical protein
MSESQLANPRKRQREALSFQRDETPRPEPKRHKQLPAHQLDASQPPPRFWNNLSKIWLTKGALRELDRRNALRTATSRTHQQAQRPLTRAFRAELEANYPSVQPADDFIAHCTPTRLRDIKLFARRDRPDLSDLRGVCGVEILPLDVEANGYL